MQNISHVWYVADEYACTRNIIMVIRRIVVRSQISGKQRRRHGEGNLYSKNSACVNTTEVDRCIALLCLHHENNLSKWRKRKELPCEGVYDYRALKVTLSLGWTRGSPVVMYSEATVPGVLRLAEYWLLGRLGQAVAGTVRYFMAV